MNLAKVVGTVVASVHRDTIDDPRFLLIEPCGETGEGGGAAIVALDLVSARIGDMVMYCQGSSCRWTFETDNQPVDTLIAGIIDRIDCGDRTVYAQ